MKPSRGSSGKVSKSCSGNITTNFSTMSFFYRFARGTYGNFSTCSYGKCFKSNYRSSSRNSSRSFQHSSRCSFVNFLSINEIFKGFSSDVSFLGVPLFGFPSGVFFFRSKLQTQTHPRIPSLRFDKCPSVGIFPAVHVPRIFP